MAESFIGLTLLALLVLPSLAFAWSRWLAIYVSAAALALVGALSRPDLAIPFLTLGLAVWVLALIASRSFRLAQESEVERP